MIRFPSALLLTVSTTAALAAQTPARPPAAPVREVTDTYFGRAVVDPYRWMEDEKDPELAAWLKAQSAYTRSRLDALKGRQKLLDRILGLDRAAARVYGVQSVAGRYFYYKVDPDSDVPKLYMRDVAGGAERLLIDPDKGSAQGTHSAIDFFSPSWDGTKVAYGVSTGGSEQSVIHVLDVASGTVLPDAIDRALYSYVSWLPGNTSFLYMRLPQVALDAPAAHRLRHAKTHVHRLGGDPDADPAILGHALSPAVEIGNRDWPLVYSIPGSRFVVGFIAHGVKNELTVYTAQVEELNGARTPWRKVADVEDEVTAFDVRGDDVYLLTHKGAPRFKIVRTSLVKPDLAAAEVVVPEGKAVIGTVGVALDGHYYKEMEAGMSWVGRLAWGGRPERIPLPFAGALAGTYTTPGIFTTPTQRGATFGLTGWTRSPVWLSYDPDRKQSVDTRLMAPSPVDFSGIEALQVLVPSHDGVKVPLSIVHKAGLKKDGQRPTLVVGYGAYGIPMEPNFQPSRLAWLERGGVLALAHARGGGEYGEEWHTAGQKKTKANTILDFIACSEYLVKSEYTSPRHLAGSGTSAGGILIGGALVRRPDLYAAAIPRVGVVNALRFEVSQGGPGNVPEFGTTAIKEEFEALYEMDAYHQVKPGTAYPAVLVTAGLNDPRVPVWQPAKFAARLQAATRSDKPVLLRVDYDAGHGLGSTRSQLAAQLADEWSFLLWQFGDPEFQPAK
ncbi:MAG TPA: prolyl oligopeptidase family serine peptidase [Vicinamibacteria bacterium]|nr:prolyl oligopeptidase family serine peptidase [Vicinamibacteria bacterium]